MKKDKNVTKWYMPVEVICYNRLHLFETRKEAREFYMKAVNMCEGSEKERYVNIVLDLITTDDKMVHDKADKEPIIQEMGRHINGEYQMIKEWETLIAYSDYLESRQEETTENDMGMSL